MEELSCEERADAYEVFMDARKREVFMTAADLASRLIWLRKKICSIVILIDVLCSTAAQRANHTNPR
ncbi:hypothetical protein EJB05_08507 [Eragrostis curvula]|uniref:Uncharacterized protein n=1 Tax=Eragrostis curvula TaxID=38414 RepID=A0A5J9W2G9_9POAL|nr:hypothetical protein EJB05_08507 [Eragrostis curvula]